MKRLALNSGEIIRRHRVLTTMAAVLAIVIYVKTTALLVGGALVEFRTPASVMGNIDYRFDNLLKPIVAGPRDEVDTAVGAVVMNGLLGEHSALLEQDSKGRWARSSIRA